MSKLTEQGTRFGACRSGSKGFCLSVKSIGASINGDLVSAQRSRQVNQKTNSKRGARRCVPTQKEVNTVIDVNGEMCYIRQVVGLDICTFNKNDADVATLVVWSATLPGEKFSVATGTKEEMLFLKNEIVALIYDRRDGYYDVDKKEWVDPN